MTTMEHAEKFGDVSPLLAPWERDPWGIERPPVTQDILEQSVLLAAGAYNLDATPWLQAGWKDLTVMVDGEITATPDDEAGEKLLTKLREKLHEMNPLVQVMETVRNRNDSVTCKAMFMAHPPVDGKALIAISFMGTGERLFDWISNFRMLMEDGIHQGFLELCRQVEAKEGEIEFPSVAKAMGRDKLTLEDVLTSMHSEDSPFRLWMCGHSQGGAVMQVYTFRKMGEGVLPQLMRGYGFASPTVMMGNRVKDPSAYPLWHVLNEEDVVTKVGAQVHLGAVLSFRPDATFRKEAYTWPTEENCKNCRKAVFAIVRKMVDTSTAMELSLAYALALSEFSTGDFLTSIKEMGLFKGLVQWVIDVADNRVDAIVNSFRKHSTKQYEEIMGKPMDMEVVEQWRRLIHHQLVKLGVKPFGDALRELLWYPHTIGSIDNETAAYRVIVRRGMEDLRPGVWLAGRPPKLHFAPINMDAVRQLRAVRRPERAQRGDSRRRAPQRRR